LFVADDTEQQTSQLASPGVSLSVSNPSLAASRTWRGLAWLWQQSNQIKSNQIKSNQIKSNRQQLSHAVF
jgi:hypothetical protein